MTVLGNESVKRMIPSDDIDDCLSNNVRRALENYFADMDGHESSNIYNLFLEQFEKPLFEVVMEVSRGNVTRAAGMLGLNRGTLRNRLKKYGID